MPTEYAVSESQLLAAIKPLRWLFSVFGLAPPPSIYTAGSLPLRLQLVLYYGYSLALLVLTVWVTFLNNAVIDTVVMDFKLDSITSALGIGQSVAVSVVQCVMQSTALLGYSQLSDILVTIVQLERDVYRHKPGASFVYRLAKGSGAFLLFLMGVLPWFNYRILANFMPPEDKMLTIFFSLLIQIKSVEYCVNVQLVHELLHVLQQDLQRLRHEIVLCECPALRLALYAELRTNQHLVGRVWRLVISIERYFALPLLVLYLYNGLSITHTINWAYIKVTYQDEGYQLDRLCYTAILIINMLIPCWLSQCCIDVYNRFGAELHNVKTSDLDLDLSNRLREYSLQLMHQKLLFTCGGFFDINLKNFGAMILTITTYVVILIQFKLQAEAERSK